MRGGDGAQSIVYAVLQKERTPTKLKAFSKKRVAKKEKATRHHILRAWGEGKGRKKKSQNV